ncbi:TetR/AcrR family transcriptional regulator [Actinomycetospora chiangmaiensis]|uniref:TetR/AcrR family transcriptional regulator n=1 Tax=Actinomycetospora chiangmaiensis TaxID=402650 RepID=UPI00036EB4B5|nr:TetR family transcriptional regulator [Actinomycetospora chiangmaiensis]
MDTREAQRRRTRRAIVDATAGLLAADPAHTPAVAEIAAAAEVSRRTVYLHFPTLDQLLLDAVLGSLSGDVDAALEGAPADDVRARLIALVDAVVATMDTSLGLGRRLVALTAGWSPHEDGAPRRGYRRVGWIEAALAPLRGVLDAGAFEDLVSALAVVIGWEAVVVLTDVRGLTVAQAGEVCRRAALALLDAATGEV